MNWIRRPEGWISALGVLAAAGLFAAWFAGHPDTTWLGRLSALLSVSLFTAVCLRFVPQWMEFWRTPQALPDRPTDREETPPYMEGKIFLTLLAVDIGVLVLVYLLRGAFGYTMALPDALEFWRCTDSEHYLDISRDWYLSQGEWRRVVQLVFLPGYPILVRLFTYVIGYDLYAGLLVSALAFAGAGSMIYRLLRLDLPHRDALRAVRWLCLLPGVFFFVTPMSDGLFVLLCACCLYFARTGRWGAGCLFGAMACFTRSTGLSLLVPLVFELIRARNQGARKNLRRGLSLLCLPAGFGAYCCINYAVSGDFFKFMEYEKAYWSQSFGLFFNTACYQLERAISYIPSKLHVTLGLWVPNLLACFGALVLVLLVVKRLRASYTAWFLAYFFVAIGCTWLLSGPRYLLGLFPMSLSMSLITKERRADLWLTAIFSCLSVLYLIAFILRWQVW